MSCWELYLKTVLKELEEFKEELENVLKEFELEEFKEELFFFTYFYELLNEL